MADPTLLESLINQPLVQVGLMLGSLIGAAVAGWVAKRDGGKGAREAPAPQSQFFFDGPFVRALEMLQGVYRNLADGRDQFDRHAELIRGDLAEIIDGLQMLNVHLGNFGNMRSRRTRRRRR